MNNFASSALPFVLPFLLVLVFNNELIAQRPAVPTINQQEEHRIKPKGNNNTYSLFISLPKNYSKTDTAHYPVLYMLDGNSGFPVAHAIRQMVDLFGGFEDFILVGIGYEWEKSYQPWFADRWNDLTPTPDPKADTSAMFRTVLDIPKGRLMSGGAERFAGILKDEIFPFIQNKYRTNDDRALYGHSFGGLFALYCLFNQPTLFRKYGISSPSVWWDNNRILSLENSFAQKNNSLNAQVFLSVGGRETPAMVSGMAALADSLKAHRYNGLLLTTRVFEDEIHSTVFAASISRTLQVFYGVKRP